MKSPLSSASVKGALGCAVLLLLQTQCDGFFLTSRTPTTTTRKTRTTTSRRHHPAVVAKTLKPSFVRLPMANQPDDDSTTSTLGFSSEVLNEAQDKLASVGWAPPRDDGALTSDDPFVQNINAGILRDFGVELDDLLNPAKVHNDRAFFLVFAGTGDCRERFSRFVTPLTSFCW